MTNFEASEFQSIWNSISEIIIERYNIGPGRKSHHTGKEMLFMILTVLKHGGQWEIIAKVFSLKGPSFERMMTKFIDLLYESLYEALVKRNDSLFNFGELAQEGKNFRHFPFARYITDVTFQQANRPSGNMQEGKVFFSGKHKLYGFKVEVSVLANGLAINCSRHHPGSVSDLEIFQRNVSFHKHALRKKGSDGNITDIGLHSGKYPDHWAFLMDKGYQDAGEMVLAITPKKKPKNGILSREAEAENRKVASDRIIGEMFWPIMSTMECHREQVEMERGSI